MYKYFPHLLIIILLTLIISLIIQVVAPAPNWLNICGDYNCQNAGRVLIIVRQEDYRGLLIQVLGGIFLVGIISVAITTLMKRKPIGVYLIVSVILYVLLRPWLFNYGRWPTPTYLGVLIGIVLTGLFLIFNRHLVTKIKH